MTWQCLGRTRANGMMYDRVTWLLYSQPTRKKRNVCPLIETRHDVERANIAKLADPNQQIVMIDYRWSVVLNWKRPFKPNWTIIFKCLLGSIQIHEGLARSSFNCSGDIARHWIGQRWWMWSPVWISHHRLIARCRTMNNQLKCMDMDYKDLKNSRMISDYWQRLQRPRRCGRRIWTKLEKIKTYALSMWVVTSVIR